MGWDEQPCLWYDDYPSVRSLLTLRQVSAYILDSIETPHSLSQVHTSKAGSGGWTASLDEC